MIRKGTAKRDVLEYIQRQNDSGIPAYIVHLSNYVEPKWKQFWSERDLHRYIEKLEKEGFVKARSQGNFIDITDAGRASLSAAPAPGKGGEA